MHSLKVFCQELVYIVFSQKSKAGLLLLSEITEVCYCSLNTVPGKFNFPDSFRYNRNTFVSQTCIYFLENQCKLHNIILKGNSNPCHENIPKALAVGRLLGLRAVGPILILD